MSQENARSEDAQPGFWQVWKNRWGTLKTNWRCCAPPPRKWKLARSIWILVVVISVGYWIFGYVSQWRTLCPGDPSTLHCIVTAFRPIDYEGKDAGRSWLLATTVALLAVFAFVSLSLLADCENGWIKFQKEQQKKNEPKDVEPYKRLPPDIKYILSFSFIIPAALFFGALVQHGYDDAAAMTVALAAIYLAAEHYASLEVQSKRVGTQELLLRQKVSSIENALGTVGGTRLIYGALAAKPVADSSGKTPARGHEVWIVYQFFPIDDAWWKATGWDDYYAKDDVKSLHYALRTGKRYDVTLVASFYQCHARERPVTTFDLPFEQFIGLIWHWIVLRTVTRTSNDAADGTNDRPPNNNTIRIAKSQQWLHLVDGHVYQLFGNEETGVKVRNLTFDLGESSDLLPIWAKREIRDVALRGVDATDFICARLLTAPQHATTDHCLMLAADHSLLTELKFDLWWQQGASRITGLTEDATRNKCINLIQTFLQLVTGSSTGRDKRTVTLGQLAQKLE